MADSPGTPPQDRSDGQPRSLVNWHVALENAFGDEQLLREIVQACLRESPGYLKALRSSINAGDAKGVLSAAHTLKGQARIFGAGRTEQVALSIELAGRAGDVDVAPSLAQLERLFAQLHAELHELLAGKVSFQQAGEVS